MWISFTYICETHEQNLINVYIIYLTEYLNLMSTYTNHFCIRNRGIKLRRLHNNQVQEINKIKIYSLKLNRSLAILVEMNGNFSLKKLWLRTELLHIDVHLLSFEELKIFENSLPLCFHGAHNCSVRNIQSLFHILLCVVDL